ncbi:hypothetical protein KJK38_00150 [Bacillus velezensis]|uniref:hypothetical protein n=1 Tax=Bacillus velezensis TaxID=492670 RepID=UPI001BD9E42E|nr:hypothetical protein [Bacillus velezensis]MBT0952042.1 hypothetical protein [Bacillus velezensis]
MVKLTIEQLEDMAFEGGINIGDVTYTVVEESGWEYDHKYQSKTVIFTDGNNHYRGEIGRSGSEWTDWTYDSEIYGADDPAEITEVEKREVVVTEWVAF